MHKSSFQRAFTEPAMLRSGETWYWQRDLNQYQGPTWSLSYQLRDAENTIDISAAADKNIHTVTVPMSTTAAYTPGLYNWEAYVSDGGTPVMIDAGSLSILAPLAPDTPYDRRPFTLQLLNAVEAALAGTATTRDIDLISTQVGDSGFTRDRRYLIELRSQLLTELRREQYAAGDNSSRLLVQFR